MNRKRNEYYHSLVGSRKWRETRAMYLSSHPLCERCLQKDRTELAVEVHHIRPIESESDHEKMKSLAYDLNNLEALCHNCHKSEHKFKPFIVRRKEATILSKKKAQSFLSSGFLTPREGG